MKRDDRLYLTVKEAVRLYSLSRQTLYRLAKKGEIIRYKLGRAVRYRCDEIEDYFRRNAVKTSRSK